MNNQGSEAHRTAKAWTRVDILSDTHGLLSSELLRALRGADVIIHAGDIVEPADWEHLCLLAPEVHGVLGNNDARAYFSSEVVPLARFEVEGLSIAVAHYREDLPLGEVDVAICGHTHRPEIAAKGRTTIINPGSASYPRVMRGPTIARFFVQAGTMTTPEIIDL